jgi:hypothetical protein
MAQYSELNRHSEGFLKQLESRGRPSEMTDSAPAAGNPRQDRNSHRVRQVAADNPNQGALFAVDVGLRPANSVSLYPL